MLGAETVNPSPRTKKLSTKVTTPESQQASMLDPRPTVWGNPHMCIYYLSIILALL
jgi:hypothetical protein